MWLWLVEVAFGCAGLVHDAIDTAESGGAEVAFEIGGGTVSATWLTRYTGSATDFGWIIPVGGPFLSLEDGDAEWVAQLRARTAPGIVWPEADAAKGCGGSSGKGDAMSGGPTSSDGVEIVAAGFTGTYDYTVVASDDPAALDTWLEENGWSSASLDTALAPYVAAGLPLALVRVSPEAEALTDTSLPPVRIAWEGDSASYPVRMAETATDDQRLTVYVVGDGAAGIGNAIADEQEFVAVADGDPNEIFEDHLARVGWALVAITEAPDGRRLTRYDASLPLGDLGDDPIFSIESADQRSHHLTFEVQEGGSAWLAPLIGAALLARRRARP